MVDGPTYIGTLYCVPDPKVTFVVRVDPVMVDHVPVEQCIEIEIGDHLTIIDENVPGERRVVFNGTVMDVNEKAFRRIPEGFDESIVLLIYKKIIKFRVILRKREFTFTESLLENIFSQ